MGGMPPSLKILLVAVGGQGSGSIQADFSGSVSLYHVQYSLAKFRLAEFLKALSPKHVAEGSLDFAATKRRLRWPPCTVPTEEGQQQD
jgi:hypothetical protein